MAAPTAPVVAAADVFAPGFPAAPNDGRQGAGALRPSVAVCENAIDGIHQATATPVNRQAFKIDRMIVLELNVSDG